MLSEEGKQWQEFWHFQKLDACGCCDGTTDRVSGFMDFFAVVHKLCDEFDRLYYCTTLLYDIMWLLSVNCQIILFSISVQHIFPALQEFIGYTYVSSSSSSLPFAGTYKVTQVLSEGLCFEYHPVRGTSMTVTVVSVSGRSHGAMEGCFSIACK